MSIHLILGGARSGKSAYAENLATAIDLPVTYIATAQVYDDEFKTRVAHHQARRPKHWELIEAPFKLAETIQKTDEEEKVLIVDCLTLWLAQCICPECIKPKNISWELEREALLLLLPKHKGHIIFVSNEVGMGIVPLGEINRQFQDEQGRLNQAIAKLAHHVSFIAAGLPIKLKG